MRPIFLYIILGFYFYNNVLDQLNSFPVSIVNYGNPRLDLTGPGRIRKVEGPEWGLKVPGRGLRRPVNAISRSWKDSGSPGNQCGRPGDWSVEAGKRISRPREVLILE